MSVEDGSKLTFHVGRLDAKGNATFAFDIARREDGGIKITNMREPLTSIERERVFAHFGSTLHERSGGSDDTLSWETSAERDPGTPEHFLAAVHMLPNPFCLVAGGE